MVLHAIKKESKSSWVVPILSRNFLRKRNTEGEEERRIELMERRGRRSKQLLEDLMEKRGYWKLF